MRLSSPPVVHFVVLGGLLFAIKNFTVGAAIPNAGQEPAVFTRARIEQLRQDWQERTGAPPDARTLAALIDQEIEDLVLIREARARGLHRSDSVVQRRLLRNMEFLEGSAGRSADELLDEAYRLGLDRTDLVVRRRLVQMLTLEVYGAARSPEATEAELREYLDAHADRFRVPARTRISHVYLSRDRRGVSIDQDARALLLELTAAGEPSAPDGARGDPFLFPADLSSLSNRELARTFGSDFAAGVDDLPAGRWSGPVASAYGLHLVWVHERTPKRPASLASVRKKLAEAVYTERGEAAFRTRVASLRRRHPVVIEPVAEAQAAP